MKKLRATKENQEPKRTRKTWLYNAIPQNSEKLNGHRDNNFWKSAFSPLPKNESSPSSQRAHFLFREAILQSHFFLFLHPPLLSLYFISLSSDPLSLPPSCVGII